MVDRQDIDALLVGALYGELTPAEEARLTAHLESHPADRSALEDLKTARQAVHESRVFDVQHEPPQAISAMLLQEAHRRAPRLARDARGDENEKESWFARLARSFLAHPAMAAAAMLVLVVGVAGTMYLRKGDDQFAGKEAESPMDKAAVPTAPAPPAAATPSGATAANDREAAGSAAFDVGLAEAGDQAEGKPGAPPPKAMIKPQPDVTRADEAVAPPKPVRHAGLKGGIAVAPSPGPMPRDLDKKEVATPSSYTLDSDSAAVTGGAGGAAPAKDNGSLAAAPTRRGSAPVMQAPPPPPPPPATATATATADKRFEPTKSPAPSAAPAPQGVQNAPAKNDSVGAQTNLLAWARGELQKTINFVHDDKCREAAKVANDIRARAPDFYEQNVAYNRELKRCAAYITNAAEQSDDRQKRNASKPAPTDSVK